MSYTNVVFKQNITRNVDRDQIEQARLNDRGISLFMQLVFIQNSKQQEISYSNQRKNPLFMSMVQRYIKKDRERFNKDFDANDRIRRNNEK